MSYKFSTITFTFNCAFWSPVFFPKPFCSFKFKKNLQKVQISQFAKTKLHPAGKFRVKYLVSARWLIGTQNLEKKFGYPTKHDLSPEGPL